MKVAIIFLYSTAITMVWWILLQADSPAAWLFFVPAVGIGLGLFRLADLPSGMLALSAAFTRVMKEGRQLWQGRG
jgi:hypothetical protein